MATKTKKLLYAMYFVLPVYVCVLTAGFLCFVKREKHKKEDDGIAASLFSRQNSISLIYIKFNSFDPIQSKGGKLKNLGANQIWVRKRGNSERDEREKRSAKNGPSRSSFYTKLRHSTLFFSSLLATQRQSTLCVVVEMARGDQPRSYSWVFPDPLRSASSVRSSFVALPHQHAFLSLPFPAACCSIATHPPLQNHLRCTAHHHTTITTAIS
jgi:hypothetical protein